MSNVHQCLPAESGLTFLVTSEKPTPLEGVPTEPKMPPELSPVPPKAEPVEAAGPPKEAGPPNENPAINKVEGNANFRLIASLNKRLNRQKDKQKIKR